jgi:hypothetical protein
MPDRTTAHVLRAYAVDFDACGLPYAAIARHLREAADRLDAVDAVVPHLRNLRGRLVANHINFEAYRDGTLADPSTHRDELDRQVAIVDEVLGRLTP